jgi:hypothetical protein
MSSKKRVFSTNNNINYNDYIKIRSGSEILSAVKYNNKTGIIDKFTNYNQFITLSDAYYKGVDLDKCDIYPTRDLNNSNISYVVGNKHVYGNDIIDNCELEKQVLYPYGFYKSNKNPNIFFPYKICMENWCQKKVNCFQYDNKCSNNNCNNECNNNCNKNCCSKKCKTGLCKNAKPLFI